MAPASCLKAPSKYLWIEEKLRKHVPSGKYLYLFKMWSSCEHTVSSLIFAGLECTTYIHQGWIKPKEKQRLKWETRSNEAGTQASAPTPKARRWQCMSSAASETNESKLFHHSKIRLSPSHYRCKSERILVGDTGPRSNSILELGGVVVVSSALSTKAGQGCSG